MSKEDLQEAYDELNSEVNWLRESLKDSEYWVDYYKESAKRYEEEVYDLEERVKQLSPENILWDPVYDILFENRNNLNPMEIEKFLNEKLNR